MNPDYLNHSAAFLAGIVGLASVWFLFSLANPSIKGTCLAGTIGMAAGYLIALFGPDITWYKASFISPVLQPSDWLYFPALVTTRIVYIFLPELLMGFGALFGILVLRLWRGKRREKKDEV